MWELPHVSQELHEDYEFKLAMQGQPEDAAEQAARLAKRNAAVEEAKKETAESVSQFADAALKPEVGKFKREQEEQLPSVVSRRGSADEDQRKIANNSVASPTVGHDDTEIWGYGNWLNYIDGWFLARSQGINHDRVWVCLWKYQLEYCLLGSRLLQAIRGQPDGGRTLAWRYPAVVGTIHEDHSAVVRRGLRS